MKMEIPAQINAAIAILSQAGHEAFLVGGCVRDALRGVKPHDFDMATSALPEEVGRLFSSCRTIETGLDHGTLTVLLDGMPIEITTYRVDGEYTDHRHPEKVTFTPSLAEDLARRDFTVNAMAYNPERGLVDLFSGEADLAAGVIRAVGEPEKRFREDALRILRALRFSARFGFSIEEKTAEAATALAPTLCEIAPERIREELFGILLAAHADEVLLRHREVLFAVVPEGNVDAHLSALPPLLTLRLAEYLLPCRECGAAEVLRRLRADNQTVRSVSLILRVYYREILPSCADICRLMREVPIEILHSAFALRKAHGFDDRTASEMLDTVLSSGKCYTVGMLAVGGNDVAALGIARGPALGAALEEAYTAVIEERVPNEKEALLAYLSEKMK